MLVTVIMILKDRQVIFRDEEIFQTAGNGSVRCCQKFWCLTLLLYSHPHNSIQVLMCFVLHKKYFISTLALLCALKEEEKMCWSQSTNYFEINYRISPLLTTACHFFVTLFVFILYLTFAVFSVFLSYLVSFVSSVCCVYRCNPVSIFNNMWMEA